jgi:RNA polymerase sigma-70 factor (ECF subfamily)
MTLAMSLPLTGAAEAAPSRFARELEAEIPEVFRFARFLCRDEEEARDLTQEVMLRALRREAEFRGASLRPYLFRICVNARKNRRRFNFVRRFVGSLDQSGSDDLPPLSERLGDGADGPELQLERRQTKDRALQALAAVPEPFRTTLVLRELHEMSYVEISVALEVEVGTVRSRIARGREALKAAFFSPAQSSKLPEQP